MKARIATITIIITLICPILVTTAWLSYKKAMVKREIKHRMMEGIDREALILIKVNQHQLDDLDWEHSREFEYLGEMYDVVFIEVKGDTTYYWCWWDHQETELNQKLKGSLSNLFETHPEKKAKEIQLINFLKSLYPIILESPEFCSYVLRTTQTSPFFLFSYLHQQNSPPTPPPRA